MKYSEKCSVYELLQITIRFPGSQLDAKQHKSLPLMCLGISSAKYDQTIGIIPPTL